MNTPDGSPLLPAFDWYQFSARVGINDLREIFAPMAADDPFKEEKPKLKGYGWAVKLGGLGGSLLVHWGGRNGDEHGPNVAGTGGHAARVSELFRATGLPHGVGRADVKLDILADFDLCRLTFIDRCNQAGMAARDHGSCPEAAKQLGRTVYGGSVGSVYQPTLYQKGLQLGDGHPQDWLRLEHRFTPTKALEKQQLSMLTPEQMCGLRPVSRDLTESICQLAVAPYKLTRPVKEKTPYYWMLSMYRNTLKGMHEDHGSWPAVGQQIGLDLELMEEEEARH